MCCCISLKYIFSWGNGYAFLHYHFVSYRLQETLVFSWCIEAAAVHTVSPSYCHSWKQNMQLVDVCRLNILLKCWRVNSSPNNMILTGLKVGISFLLHTSLDSFLLRFTLTGLATILVYPPNTEPMDSLYESTPVSGRVDWNFLSKLVIFVDEMTVTL